jgi:hypothetical protein
MIRQAFNHSGRLKLGPIRHLDYSWPSFKGVLYLTPKWSFPTKERKNPISYPEMGSGISLHCITLSLR